MRLRTRVVLASALLCTGLLSGCSKTVQWEEEVLVNTGKIIKIKRTTELRYDISQDRLFSPYWQFKGETLSFDWRGVKYSYRSEPGDPNLITVNPLVLAIDQSELPNILGYADSYWVHHKSQGCAAAPVVRLVAWSTQWRVAAALEPGAGQVCAKAALLAQAIAKPASVAKSFLKFMVLPSSKWV